MVWAYFLGQVFSVELTAILFVIFIFLKMALTNLSCWTTFCAVLGTLLLAQIAHWFLQISFLVIQQEQCHHLIVTLSNLYA